MTPIAGKRGWSTSSSLVGKGNGGCFDNMLHSDLIVITMIIMMNGYDNDDDDDIGRQGQGGVL